MAPLSIPVEIWRTIADFVTGNPLTFMRLSQISRSAKTVFLSDHLWREFDLVGSSVDIGPKFVERMANANRMLQAIVYEGWKWLAHPLPRPEFSALGFCINEEDNSPCGLISLSINIQRIYYCHILSDFADAKFMVALKVLSDMERDNRLAEPFSRNESVVMQSIDNSDPFFMAMLCRYSRKASFLVAPNLRMDPHFVLQILKTTGEFIANDNLLENYKFACAAIKVNPQAFYRLSCFHDDLDIATLAISSNPYLLSYASDRLQDNKDLVILAVSLDGDALEYASERLQKDKEVVYAALSENGHAVEFVAEELLDDWDIKMTALKNAAFLYKVCDEVPCSDRNLALIAVKYNTTNLTYLTPELQKDPEILKMSRDNDIHCLMPALGFPYP